MKTTAAFKHDKWFYQWRIYGMDGMARAMGATLTGGAKIKILMYSFLSLYFAPHASTEQG